MKIALHLERTRLSPACTPPALVCDDNPWTLSNAVIRGDVRVPYYIYFIALDVNTSIGVRSVSFTFEHDDSLSVLDWQLCSGHEVTSNDWPASGSGITLSFDECVGTSADPNDPEGDGSILLGSLYVYAYAPGIARIGNAAHTQKAVVTNCSGDTTQIAWTDHFYTRALGEVGFGDEGWLVPACEFDGFIDDACAQGWSDWMTVCCMPDSTCGNSQAQVSQRACEYAGGVWRVVPCRSACYDVLCNTVPVLPLTWGKLKSKY